MIAHDSAIGRANFTLVGQILCLVGNIPRQPGDIARLSPRFPDHGQNILERLAHLADEVVGFEFLIGIPADLPADKQHAPLADHPVGVTFGRFPAIWVHIHCWHIGLLSSAQKRAITVGAISARNKITSSLKYANIKNTKKPPAEAEGHWDRSHGSGDPDQTVDHIPNASLYISSTASSSAMSSLSRLRSAITLRMTLVS